VSVRERTQVQALSRSEASGAQVQEQGECYNPCAECPIQRESRAHPKDETMIEDHTNDIRALRERVARVGEYLHLEAKRAEVAPLRHDRSNSGSGTTLPLRSP